MSHFRKSSKLTRSPYYYIVQLLCISTVSTSCIVYFIWGDYFSDNNSIFMSINSSYVESVMESVMSQNPQRSEQANCKESFIQGCQCFKNVCKNSSSFVPSLDVYNSDNFETPSSCSSEASYVGRGQKIVSFSLFKSGDERSSPYSQGMALNLYRMRRLYPGWLMRVYTDFPLEKDSDLCKLYCNTEDFFYCDVTNLPRLGNVNGTIGVTWRFIPLGDPTVSTFLSRDLDSIISKREAVATREWEASNKTFHLIRDHKYHKVPIMAGMFGIKAFKLRNNEDKSYSKSYLRHVKEQFMEWIKVPWPKCYTNRSITMILLLMTESTAHNLWKQSVSLFPLLQEKTLLERRLSSLLLLV